MDCEKQWLDSMLEKYCQSKGFKNVKASESSSMAEGANFTSDMELIKIEVEEKNGKRSRKTILKKVLLPELIENTMMKEWQLFETEIKMYSRIFPSMEKLLCGSEPLWPKCIGYRNFDRLLLEDLKEEGFKMAVRTEGLDLDHCLLAMRGLAKYHALSVAAVNGGQSDITGLPPYVFDGRLEMSNQYLRNCLSAACKVTAPLWPEEMNYYKEAIQKLASVEINELAKVCKNENSKLKVLNHGDCWVNNFMFRYDEKTKKPTSVRFVDFQMSHYGSYAMDLQYFIGTSLNSQVRENEQGRLIEEYQLELKRSLEGYQLGERAPSVGEVEEEMGRCEVVGLMAATTILPLVLSEGDDVPKKKSDDDWEARLRKSHVRFSNQAYSRALLLVLKSSKAAGRLDRLI